MIAAAVLIALATGCGAQQAADAPASSRSSSTPKAATARRMPALARDLEALTRTVVLHLARRDAPGDAQYFRAGLWHSADESCWACNVAPATAAAVLANRGLWRRGWLRRLAMQTFDRMIARQSRDGSYPATRVPADSAKGDGIVTMFASVELGSAYHELEPWLGERRRARWGRALAAATTYVQHGGNLGFYVNGNINLGYAELAQLTYLATGDQRYRTLTDQALDFALRPPAPRWVGHGLVVTRAPTRPDDADGRGYLVESGAGGSGYDPEYTQLQADVVSRMYVLGPTPRLERLLNLLTNQLRTDVDSRYLLVTDNGTRHPQVGRRVPFVSPALVVLGARAGRSGLAARATMQLAQVQRTFRGAYRYSNPPVYRSVGNQLAVMLQALLAPRR
ncbi:MAG: hypothetical protein V7607_737 [Solirubrobacteraceae bacterium]